MRKTIFMALLAAVLVLVPTVVPSAAFAADPKEILRDCADDGIIQGNYTPSEMRNARNNMPAELDEYSDCRDVLSREIAAKTAGTNNSSNGGGNSGSGGGSTTGGGGGTSAPTATPTTAPSPTATPTGRDVGIQIGPATPEDWKALEKANVDGGTPINLNGREVRPAAAVGRNGLPGTVVAVLALIAVAAFSVTVPFFRLRVVARSSPA